MMLRAVVLLSKYRALLPYIEAQAKLETDNFTSRVYLENHNCFGIKYIYGRRGQIATKGLLSPEGDYYANFTSDSASVIDLLKIFEARKFPTSVKDADEYASRLKGFGYFGGDLQTYVKILSKYLKV